jgi:hypothetical protein
MKKEKTKQYKEKRQKKKEKKKGLDIILLDTMSPQLRDIQTGSSFSLYIPSEAFSYNGSVYSTTRNYCFHCTVVIVLFSFFCFHCTVFIVLFSLYCFHCSVFIVENSTMKTEQ